MEAGVFLFENIFHGALKGRVNANMQAVAIARYFDKKIVNIEFLGLSKESS